MSKIKQQKYMNPITLEAKMFVKSLNELSEIYNCVDKCLVNALESVMLAIDRFLEKSSHEILSTRTTELVDCKSWSLKHLKRAFYCERCEKDLGECAAAATKHVIEKCGTFEAIEYNENAVKADQVLEERRVVKAVTYPESLAKHIKIANDLKCHLYYDQIKEALRCVVKSVYPNETINLYMFGSRLAGIGTLESHLEIFVNVGENNEKNLKNHAKLRKILSSLGKHWTCSKEINKDFMQTTYAGIVCDIHFSNILGYINSTLFEYFFELQPIARILCIYFKRWLLENKIRLISTQAMVLMVIFYLQQINYLPSVEQLQKKVDLESAFNVGPWLCSYVSYSFEELNLPATSIPDEPEDDCVKFLFKLFKFYIDFDYGTCVICPYLGTIIKKIDLDKFMPKRYTNFVAKKSVDSSWHLGPSIVVQNPMQLNYNAAEAITPFAWNSFKELMFEFIEGTK